MLDWLKIYLDQMESSQEMIQLIRNFFQKISNSPHYIRNEVNDALFELLVQNVKFKIIGTPKNKILEKIDTVFLMELKKEFLQFIGDKLVRDTPEEPPKIASIFSKKIKPKVEK